MLKGGWNFALATAALNSEFALRGAFVMCGSATGTRRTRLNDRRSCCTERCLGLGIALRRLCLLRLFCLHAMVVCELRPCLFKSGRLSAEIITWYRVQAEASTDWRLAPREFCCPPKPFPEPRIRTCTDRAVGGLKRLRNGSGSYVQFRCPKNLKLSTRNRVCLEVSKLVWKPTFCRHGHPTACSSGCF